MNRKWIQFNLYLRFLSTTMTIIMMISSTMQTPTITPAMRAESLLEDAGVAGTIHTHTHTHTRTQYTHAGNSCTWLNLSNHANTAERLCKQFDSLIELTKTYDDRRPLLTYLKGYKLDDATWPNKCKAKVIAQKVHDQ